MNIFKYYFKKDQLMNLNQIWLFKINETKMVILWNTINRWFLSYNTWKKSSTGYGPNQKNIKVNRRNFFLFFLETSQNINYLNGFFFLCVF